MKRGISIELELSVILIWPVAAMVFFAGLCR